MGKIILIISGGSTMGKTTIANKLVENEGFYLYRPLTTRDSREDEIYHQYRHVSTKAFEKEIEDDSFVFHDFLFGNYYGIFKDVEDFIAQNPKSLFLIPSWRMQDLISHIDKDLLAIHIVSDEVDKAKKRLLQRGKINGAEIVQRIDDLKRQNEVKVEASVRITNSQPIEEIYTAIILNLKKRFNGEN